jgi:hypothetical protein
MIGIFLGLKAYQVMIDNGCFIIITVYLNRIRMRALSFIAYNRISISVFR